MNFNASDDVQYYEKPLCEKLLNEINYSFYNLMFFFINRNYIFQMDKHRVFVLYWYLLDHII